MSKRGAPDVADGQFRLGGVEAPGALPHTPTFGIECIILMPYFFSSEERSTLHTGRYFNSKPAYNGFVQEFDLVSRHAITPTRYTPKPYVYENLAVHDPPVVNAKGSEMHYSLGDGQFASLHVQADEFSSGKIVVRAKLATRIPYAEIGAVPSSTSAVLREIASGRFRQLMKKVGALVGGSKETPLGNSGRISIHTKITVPEAEDVVAKFLSAHTADLVALHISRDPTLIPDPRLSLAVVNAADDLNLKSESQLLLLNAQGSTLLLADSTTRRIPFYHNRFERVADLSEIALSMQYDLLHRERSTGPIQNHPEVDLKSMPYKSWISYPQNVFHTSVSNQKIWQVVSKALYLESIAEELFEVDGIALP
ncbi:hypothetical protein [Arthrobacter sp. zg-Y769]|uniref:hypothetical protein n=1 Tax=Arthrobacter sp. zg-Y769 TaxID=2894191 RepID=UPI001E5A5AC1|nr:hypothetical protein [Arthrobacter sp. zg-Y769]MCC9204972.1 hypothetical protein [Arthrobacter sp. zg-Y769]